MTRDVAELPLWLARSSIVCQDKKRYLFFKIKQDSTHPIYIKKNVCLFVCLYGIYTNSHFWTDLNQTLHKSPPWSGRDRRVCMGPKFLTSSTFWALFSFGATAESWAQDGCRRNRFPRYPYNRDSSWCSRRRHWHEVVADGGVIRDSLISVILAGVPLTSRKWRCGTAVAATTTTTTTMTKQQQHLAFYRIFDMLFR
jgi:hypothetical protein